MMWLQKRLLVATAALGTLALGACEVDRGTGERTLTGAGVGAAAGATYGLIRGDFLSNTVGGAAAGAAGGFVYDAIKKRQ